MPIVCCVPIGTGSRYAYLVARPGARHAAQPGAQLVVRTVCVQPAVCTVCVVPLLQPSYSLRSYSCFSRSAPLSGGLVYVCLLYPFLLALLARSTSALFLFPSHAYLASALFLSPLTHSICTLSVLCCSTLLRSIVARSHCSLSALVRSRSFCAGIRPARTSVSYKFLHVVILYLNFFSIINSLCSLCLFPRGLRNTCTCCLNTTVIQGLHNT